MPLSDEQKAKMAAGRAAGVERRKLEREALAAQAKDATAMPAGHQRDEQVRINADHLQAAQEQRMEDIGVEAIDHAKLTAEPSNEAMQYAIEQRRKRFEHKDGVPGAVPGWHYVWMPVPGGVASDNAKSNIRRMQADAKREGYIPVQDDDPEFRQYKGNDAAAGTTMRGLMDCVLMKIRIEDKILMEYAANERKRRLGAVEENGVVWAQDHLQANRLNPVLMHGAAGEGFQRDPILSRIAGQAGQVETFTAGRPQRMTTTFNEGDIRRGSIPGMPIGRS